MTRGLATGLRRKDPPGRRDKAPSRDVPSQDAVIGTSALYVGFMLLVLVEYGGLAALIPVLKAVRFSTLLSYAMFLYMLVRIGYLQVMRRPQSKMLLVLVFFTAASVAWAIVQWSAVHSIRPLVEYMIFFLLTASLLDRQSRIDKLSWLFLGLSVFLIASNFDKIASGERSGSFEAAYFMGDGNDFAWGLIVMLPIILNLALGNRPVWTRVAALLGCACCVVGVVGSGSRGAALGLASAMFYYWLVMSRHKALGVAAIAFVVVGILALAPARYLERIHSISDYQEDSSAQGRLQVWKASIQMAVDYPLGVGAGNFSSAYGRYYMPSDAESAIGWAPRRWLAAHSIYFKVLGEYGILGLVLLLAIIRRNLLDNAATRRRLLAAPDPGRHAPTWPGLLNMSIVGFSVCGVFLGGISYPHLFLLSGLTVATARMAGAQVTGPAPSRARA